jgi:hypothetical protein
VYILCAHAQPSAGRAPCMRGGSCRALRGLVCGRVVVVVVGCRGQGAAAPSSVVQYRRHGSLAPADARAGSQWRASMTKDSIEGAAPLQALGAGGCDVVRACL